MQCNYVTLKTAIINTKQKKKQLEECSGRIRVLCDRNLHEFLEYKKKNNKNKNKKTLALLYTCNRMYLI